MPNTKSLLNKNKSKSNPYLRLFFSSAVGTGLFFLLIAFLSLIAIKLNVPDWIYMPAGLIFGCLIGFFAGYTSVIPFKEKWIIYASLGGLTCVALCGTVSFAVNRGRAGTGIFLLSSIILISSIIGGFISSRKKRKRK